MNRYEISTPRTRAAFGMAAVAMTAITLGLSVVLPASLAPAEEVRPVAAVKAIPAEGDVVVRSMRIDVVGERERHTAFEPAREIPARRAQEG